MSAEKLLRPEFLATLPKSADRTAQQKPTAIQDVDLTWEEGCEVRSKPCMEGIICRHQQKIPKLFQ